MFAWVRRRLGLDRIEGLLHDIARRQEITMATLDDLKTKVAALTTVNDSIITLLGGLAQQVRDLQPNQASIDELAASIDGQVQEIADAVTANTPAANSARSNEAPAQRSARSSGQADPRNPNETPEQRSARLKR